MENAYATNRKKIVNVEKTEEFGRLSYLEEENEADPLVVGVVFFGVLVVEIVGYSRMGHVLTGFKLK